MQTRSEVSGGKRLALLALVLALTGCGAEVAGTAATVGALKAKEAEQAQKQLDQVRQRLEAASAIERQQLKAAGD